MNLEVKNMCLQLRVSHWAHKEVRFVGRRALMWERLLFPLRVVAICVQEEL